GGRNQSVDALSLPRSYGDLPLDREARLQPDHRHGRRGDQVYNGIECRRAGEAFLSLLRARWYARAASPDARMDREDERQIRHGLERNARSNFCQPEEARCHPAEYPAHSVAGSPAEVGYTQSY